MLLYEDRRLGKSSAIHAAARQVRNAGYAVAVVDLASASTAPGAVPGCLTALAHI